jgi:hypothetical protein
MGARRVLFHTLYVLGQNGPQLVNYYRGSSALTLKSSMVRTLRSYIREKHLDEEAVGLPMTFIVYPQREQAREQATPASDENTGALHTSCIALWCIQVLTYALRTLR